MTTTKRLIDELQGEAVGAGMSLQSKIQSSLVDRINSSYAEFVELSRATKERQIAGANKARECGILLLEFGRNCPHREFQRKFASAKGKAVTDHTFPMSYDHASLLMRIANRYDEPFTADNYPERARSLHDLLYAPNQLPMPEGHGEQQLHQTRDNFFIAFNRHLTSFASWWDKQDPLKAAQDWPRDVKQQFLMQFEPALEKMNEIYATVKAGLRD